MNNAVHSFPSWEEQQRVLHGPFDLETHQKTFIDYLEVCITPDGTICYAIPSHQEFMMNYWMKKEGITREEIINLSDEEPGVTAVEFLCKHTGCICIWSNGWCGYGTPTPEQIQSLNKLKDLIH